MAGQESSGSYKRSTASIRMCKFAVDYNVSFDSSCHSLPMLMLRTALPLSLRKALISSVNSPFSRPTPFWNSGPYLTYSQQHIPSA